MPRALRRLVSRAEAWQIRRFGRSGLGVVFRTDVLALTVPGRRTGVPRTTPLAFVELDDGSWLVSGGAGGSARVDWVANARARAGTTTVAVGRQREVPVTVEEPAGDESERLRSVALARWPRVAVYERRSGRRVPVFVLRPSGNSPARAAGRGEHRPR